MPCYTSRTTTVDIGKVDKTMLHAALEALGLNPRAMANGTIVFAGGQYANGTLTLKSSNAQELTSEIKRAYSGQVVVKTAQRYGWQVKKTGEHKYQVVKR